MSGEQVKRPVLRWHGGKWLLGPWIISHFPPHLVYVEPFGGAASVLLRKPRAYAEVYNDLDDEVVNLFQVLRSGRADELVAMLRLTPFARREFEWAYSVADDPVERARRLVILSFMGFGAGLGVMRKSTGFRADSNRSGSTPAHDWANYADALPAIIERLQGVVIERRPACDLMLKHDRPDALFYVDPPYVHTTRSRASWHCYAHEMTDRQHREMADVLQSLTGMVVLSGYPSKLYERAFASWLRVEREALADGARPRIEVLWLNKAAWEGLERARIEARDLDRLPLLDGVCA